MRVLGLDLALGIVGWAVLDSGDQPTLVAKGRFELPDRRASKTISERSDTWLTRRAATLVINIESLLVEHGPVNLLAYEYPDYVRGPWSGGSKGRESSVMQAMGRAEGILVGHHGACRACRGIPLVGVSTSEAKSGFAGKRDAPKSAILSHCRLWFPGHAWSADRQDEADAVSIAWCAALASTSDPRLAAVVGRR